MSTPERFDPEHRYHDLYENMPVMYFEMDADGGVVSVNAFGAQQLGYAPDELVGRSVLDVFHEDDRASVAAHFKTLIEREGMASWEFRKRRKDGSVLWVRESARTIRTSAGRIEVMVVCQDITARKRAEEERREAERLVRQLSMQVGAEQERERRRIAVHLHDDVGQSLVLACIKLDHFLEESATGGAEGLLEVKRLLQEAIEATRTLTFDLASPVLYELGLPDALRSLCERQERHCGTRFRLECDDDLTSLPERVAVPLYRIASELVVNVRKHAEAREALVRLRSVDGRVALTVEDDGKGFAPGRAHVPAGASTGIGLFTIEQRVELLGGVFRVESSPGEGSRFTIELRLEGAGALGES